MFGELRQILRAAGMPFDAEELLDALWLASRLPQGPDTPLATQWANTQQTNSGPEEPAAASSGATVPGPGDHTTSPPRERRPSAHSGPSGLASTVDTTALTPLTSARLTGNGADRGIRVPGLKALGGELAFGRALRPLKRRVPSAHATEVDEDATAAAQADTHVPQVVLRPQPERWFRLAFVIDSAASMLLWERHCTELLSVFERSGAFRQIEVHQLRYRNTPSQDAITLTRPWSSDDAQTLPPHCVTDPSGRTMVIVVTDGAAPAWHDGRMHAVVQDWATAGPTALIHVLPRPLWSGSGITADMWHVSAPRAGAANTHWHVAHPVLPPSLADFTTVPIPVLELTPPGLASWATALTTLGQPIPLRLWAPRNTAPAKPAADASASALTFSRTASPQSVRLAAHLAAMAPLTVPVMQLVHSCLPGSHHTAVLAEVFLSGLLAPLPSSVQPSVDIRHRMFDFTGEAKDLLLDTVPATELLSSSRRVGERIATLVGRSSDFPAWLLTPSPASVPATQPQPFARVGRSLLVRLGRNVESDQPQTSSHDDATALRHPTVVILASLSVEYDAIRARITDVEELTYPGDIRVERGQLPGTPWHVALIRPSGRMRVTAALIERLHTWLSPQALFFVGIAGALKSDTEIGDVVVATHVYSIHDAVPTAQGTFTQSEAWRLTHRLEQIARRALRHTECRVHFKPIVAGNIVIAGPDSAFAREYYNDAVAIDMEGAGVTSTRHISNSTDMLIIRGISDGPNTRKRTRPSKVAAQHAAIAAVTVLRELQPRDALRNAGESLDSSDVPNPSGGVAPSDITPDSPETQRRWPNEPSHTRLVMIARTEDPVLAGGRFDHLGTGFLLGPRLIVTAAHVLNTRDRSGTIKVRNKRGTVTAAGWVDCHVLWTHHSYDAALLLADKDLAEPATDRRFTSPSWAELADNTQLGPCHVTGLVLQNETAPQTSGHLTGTLHPVSSHREATYEFEPDPDSTRSLATRGMSGAPVFFGEFLLGFVSAMRGGDSRSSPRLAIVGISSLVNDRNFANACRQFMRRVPRVELLPAMPSRQDRDDRGQGAHRAPRVFISYAHEDGTGAQSEHVRNLAQLLRTEGIDVRVDQFERRVVRDWVTWMQQEMETANVILVVASPAYKRSADNSEGDASAGVAFEARLLRNELAHIQTAESKLILPVLLPGNTSTDLPAFLRHIKPLVIDPRERTGIDQLLLRLIQKARDPDLTDPFGLADRLLTSADYDRRSGDREAALAKAAQAIEVYRRRAAEDPDTYLPSLAATLDHASIWLAEAGQWEEGLESVREAVFIRRQLADTNPDANLADLAHSLSNAAMLGASQNHDISMALDEAGEAVEIFRALAERQPSAYIGDLQEALITIADLAHEQGDLDRAVEAIEQAVAIARELWEHSSDHGDRARLASTLEFLGTIRDARGETEASLAATAQAVGIYRELDAEQPDGYREELIRALGDLAVFHAKLGLWGQGAELGEEAVELARALVSRHGDTHLVQLAKTMNNTAALLRRLDQHDRALAYLDEVVSLYRGLADRVPGSHLAALAGALHNLGSCLHEMDRHHDAIDAYDESIAIYRKLSGPQRADYEESLAETLVGLAHAHVALANESTALDLVTKAVELLDNAMRGDRNRTRRKLAEALQLASAIAFDLGLYEQALRDAERAADLFHHILAHDTDQYLHENYATVLHAWARALDVTEDHDRAARVFGDTIAAYRALPDDEAREELAGVLVNAAVCASARDDNATALALARESVTIHRELAHHGAANTFKLAEALNNLADVYCDRGEWPQAQDIADEAVTLAATLRASNQPDADSLAVYALITRARATDPGNTAEAATFLRRARQIADNDNELQELVRTWADQLGVPQRQLR